MFKITCFGKLVLPCTSGEALITQGQLYLQETLLPDSRCAHYDGLSGRRSHLWVRYDTVRSWVSPQNKRIVTPSRGM